MSMERVGTQEKLNIHITEYKNCENILSSIIEELGQTLEEFSASFLVRGEYTELISLFDEYSAFCSHAISFLQDLTDTKESEQILNIKRIIDSFETDSPFVHASFEKLCDEDDSAYGADFNLSYTERLSILTKLCNSLYGMCEQTNIVRSAIPELIEKVEIVTQELQGIDPGKADFNQRVVDKLIEKYGSPSLTRSLAFFHIPKYTRIVLNDSSVPGSQILTHTEAGMKFINNEILQLTITTSTTAGILAIANWLISTIEIPVLNITSLIITSTVLVSTFLKKTTAIQQQLDERKKFVNMMAMLHVLNITDTGTKNQHRAWKAIKSISKPN